MRKLILFSYSGSTSICKHKCQPYNYNFTVFCLCKMFVAKYIWVFLTPFFYTSFYLIIIHDIFDLSRPLEYSY